MTGRRTESDRYAGATAAALTGEADLHFSVITERQFCVIRHSRSLLKLA
jgi:hypothetical protein